MHPAKKSGQALGYGKTQEDGKDEVASRSDKDETGMKHSQSIRSAADGNFNERVVKMENDISVLQQQQDSFRQLLSLKDTVENLLKDQKTLQGLIKRTTLIEERLEEFENRFDEYQRKTEQFLVVLDKNIDEESAIRADENKQIKKVCTELERRQKEMDYEVKMDIKNTEIKLKQELVDVCANIDKKTDAHKEFLENHINAIHRAIKSTIIDDEERLDALTRKVEGAHAHFDSQIKRLDETVIPTIDSANKRRKVDYADLKAWLLESIDERLNNKEKKLEDTVKKSYKSTVVKQKSEIENLKREVSLLGASPNRNTKGSNIAPSEPFNDDQYNDNFESGNEDRKSGFEFVNVEKQEIQATEFRPQNSIKETKERMEQIERFTINSGDEIGNKLDQQKISIFDWNDKILKASKKLEKFKKNKKMNNKKEIRGNKSLIHHLLFKN